METRFEQGNMLQLRHGAYSTILLSERAAVIADELWSVLPSKSPAFAAAVATAAMAAARLERAMTALDSAGPLDLERLDRRAQTWLRTFMGALAQLGLTPASAAKLRLHVVVGDSAKAALEAHLEAHYGGGAAE